MVTNGRSVDEYLDEMGLKMVLIEPGDLSVIGELLGLAEELLAGKGGAMPLALEKMAGTFVSVLNNLIMGDLTDSASTFEELGQCIIWMQEVSRKGDGQECKAEISKFCSSLEKIGFVVDRNSFGLEAEAKVEVERREPEPEVHEGEVKSPGDADGQASQPDFLHDTELLSGFIEEAIDHLESIEVNVLELETSPGDVEIINRIFRPFHTIKGVSGFLNLRKIQKLAHTTENLLDDVRNSVLPMNAEVINVVLKVGDYLRTMVENIKKVLDEGQEHYHEYDISEYVTWIQQIQAGGAASAVSMVVPEAPLTPPPVRNEALVTPAPAAMPEKSMEKVVASVAMPAARSKPSPEPEEEAVPFSRGEAEAVSSPVSRQQKVGVSIKVAVEKLDSLVNAVGELVIMQAMVQQNPLIASLSDPKLSKDFSQLSRITSELQKTAMAMRMVPIRQTFQKMIRLVRDLSIKSGKTVELIMSGEETEVDRNMVDSIYDPLVHMIRNSVDHGVQPAAERQRAGKPAAGTVKLSAYQKGGNIVIEIEDDGEGLNSEKIKRKALERGLIQASDKLSAHDLNNLIFLPGFSTADRITDVSGRGVGMDVVKKAVEKMRGRVEVISESGKGSQFIIRLPLTLAIIDGIIVRVGTERYIIPTVAIQESIKPEAERFTTIHGKGEALMIRDSLVPIIRLYQMFGVKGAGTDPLESIMVVVENEGRRRALMVDELLGKQEVVIKSLGGLMKDIQGVAGGTILGDGRVGLILDLAGIVGAGK